MTASLEEPLVLEITKHRVCWITLNRPMRRNTLSLKMLSALSRAIETARNDSQIRVIVLSAAGPVFCAGHDLREMAYRPDESRDTHQARISEILQLCSTMMLGIVHCPKPVIACVQGTASAAGCQLVSICDLAVASTAAQFCTPGVNIGGFCTTPLVGIGRNMHRKHAMAMALTGDAITADQAMGSGLINSAVPPDKLIHRVTELSELIASKSAQGIRAGKADFYRQLDMPLEEAFAYANQSMVHAMTTNDALEGNAAFFDKRAPLWEED